MTERVEPGAEHFKGTPVDMQTAAGRESPALATPQGSAAAGERDGVGAAARALGAVSLNDGGSGDAGPAVSPGGPAVEKGALIHH